MKGKFRKDIWVHNGIDYYWVECTFKEAERNVFPYLS